MEEENTNLSAKELNAKGSKYYANEEYEKAFEYFKSQQIWVMLMLFIICSFVINTDKV
ncbi:MAG: hypothetical protein LKE30_00780 [Bacteroidales bacterium]|jgi:hypothetical protein|nr:hypothetical protein [Bacteroidales bacterium]